MLLLMCDPVYHAILAEGRPLNVSPSYGKFDHCREVCTADWWVVRVEDCISGASTLMNLQIYCAMEWQHREAMFNDVMEKLQLRLLDEISMSYNSELDGGGPGSLRDLLPHRRK